MGYQCINGMEFNKASWAGRDLVVDLRDIDNWEGDAKGLRGSGADVLAGRLQ